MTTTLRAPHPTPSPTDGLLIGALALARLATAFRTSPGVGG
jgi:hypothetical protein